MRRARTAFAWVSMMDLLFGLFGGLLVLTMLISAKLGHSAGIEERPFNLVVVTVTAQDAAVREALSRMHFGFDVANDAAGHTCRFSAAVTTERCRVGDALVKFATAAKQAPMATLFLASSGEASAVVSMAVTPVLRDIAVLLDGAAPLQGDETVTVRLSVKSGASFWEPLPFTYTVDELVALAEGRPLSDVPLLAKLQGGCTSTPQNACKILEIKDGAFVFHP